MDPSKPLAGKRVAVLVETEYIYDEIAYYKKLVPTLGGEVVLLAYLWGKQSIDFVNDIDSPDRPATSLHRLTVDQCVTEHDPNEYDVVICAANYVSVRLREIPPMGSLASPELTATAPAVQFFARAMANPNIVKAAMCHALWILTPRPDILRGRQVICHTVVLADICNAGATYIPAPSHVVVDRDLVTARSFADVEAYFDAIIQTVVNGTGANAQHFLPNPQILNGTADKIVRSLESRFTEASANFHPGNRPVARAAGGLLDGSLDIAAEVRRMIGVDLDTTCPGKHKPILIVASKFGTWASELTVVTSVLLNAGYTVRVATEDGSPPHFLAPSMDPTFQDGAWRCSVVSPEERDLAFKFLNPTSQEHDLLKRGNVLDLSKLPRPPQIGDYLRDSTLLSQYRQALNSALKMADDFEAIVVTGGSGAIPGWMADRGLQNLILAFNDLGKPIMAECNGGLAVAQCVDPSTGRSILSGRAVTTHSWLDEYQNGWGWISSFPKDPDSFWSDGRFDFPGYSAAEQWQNPGLTGNPLVDSEALFKNAAGPHGRFYSPAGTPYSVVVDGHLITCRTTPDGYPGILALMAILDGRPALRGTLFLDANERGESVPYRATSVPHDWTGPSPLEVARDGNLELLVKWLAGGGDPDVTDTDGWTPLLVAAARGNSAMVEMLLWHQIPGAQRANPDIRFPGADGLPIYMAGQSGDVETVKQLLKARPGHVFDVATVNGHTVLLQAAFYGQKPHQELARYLLTHIGSILSIPATDELAISSARRRLLAVTNVRGQNPIALAEAYNIRPMVELLKRFGTPNDENCQQYYHRLLLRIAPPLPRNEEESRLQNLTDRLTVTIQNGLDHFQQTTGSSTNNSVLVEPILAAIDEALADPQLQINRLGGPLQRTPLITTCTGADANPGMKNLRSAIAERLLGRQASPLIHEVHAMGVNAVVRAAVWGHLYLLQLFTDTLKPEEVTCALNEKAPVNGFTALHDSVLRALSAQGDLLDQYLEQIRWEVGRGVRYDIEDHTGRTQEVIARAALADPDFSENAHKVLVALLGGSATN